MNIESAALWAEVDVAKIKRNVASLRSLLPPATRLLAVVKANGYGHGDAPVAAAAVEGGAEWLGVARVDEGRSLRDSGISNSVLLLAEPPPTSIDAVFDLDLTPTVYSEDLALELSSHAQRRNTNRSVHLKVDTGMHRYGVQPEDFVSFFDRVAGLKGLEIAGIWSHFAVAEDVLNPYTKQQYARFLDILDALGTRVDGLIKHLANSAGTITFPEAHLDMVRAGIAVYGIHPSRDLAERIPLEPALSFKSRVGHVKRLAMGEAISYGQTYSLPRDATVVTIPCGYADGLRRALSNKGAVLIGGKRYQICGNITMDHFLVDVGDDEIEVADEAVMIGRQGGNEITAHEIADLLGTIPYEVVCGISARVPRFYTGG